MSKLTMRQFWAWLEFDRLHPFMQEREDWRTAMNTSAIYNVNIVDKDKMTTAEDFTYPTMEEIIEKQVEREQEVATTEEVLGREQDMSEKEAAIRAWEQRVERLTAGRKPVQTTFQG